MLRACRTGMHSEYLRRLFLDNDLAEGRFTLAGGGRALPTFARRSSSSAPNRDHVAPWRSVYKFHLQTDAEVTFLLTSGGHNAGIVSEPGMREALSRGDQAPRRSLPRPGSLACRRADEGRLLVAGMEGMARRTLGRARCAAANGGAARGLRAGGRSARNLCPAGLSAASLGRRPEATLPPAVKTRRFAAPGGTRTWAHKGCDGTRNSRRNNRRQARHRGSRYALPSTTRLCCHAYRHCGGRAPAAVRVSITRAALVSPISSRLPAPARVSIATLTAGCPSSLSK